MCGLNQSPQAPFHVSAYTGYSESMEVKAQVVIRL